MGQGSSCEECPPAARHSVFSFSEELVNKITDGIPPAPLSQAEMDKRNQEDYEWFKKIKCIDDSHSTAYGLTPESFEALVRKLERKLKGADINLVCEYDTLKECYKENERCAIKCAKDTEDFINCLHCKNLQLTVSRLRQLRLEEAEMK